MHTRHRGEMHYACAREHKRMSPFLWLSRAHTRRCPLSHLLDQKTILYFDTASEKRKTRPIRQQLTPRSLSLLHTFFLFMIAAGAYIALSPRITSRWSAFGHDQQENLCLGVRKFISTPAANNGILKELKFMAFGFRRKLL